jgi:hypothetical protein
MLNLLNDVNVFSIAAFYNGLAAGMAFLKIRDAIV